MADISTWSTTAASNNSSPPDGWPEGQNASTVNDCARENMAQIATWRQKFGGWMMENVGIAAAVAANDLTVSLKVKDGSTAPSSTNKVGIGFRSATLTSGAFEYVQATAATSVVLPATGTLGAANSATINVFVYAINNAGAIELAIAGQASFDEGIVHSTTAIGTGSDSAYILYSTSARTNVAIRLIGKITIQHGTAAWTNSPTVILPYSLEMRPNATSTYVSGTNIYIHTDGADSTGFDVDGNVTENSFESVGPTGSSATNIWTPMDAIPPGARIAIIRVRFALNDAAAVNSTMSASIQARMTGSTASGNFNNAATCSMLVDDHTNGIIAAHPTFYAPLDSARRFDVTWSESGSAAFDIQLYLVGFIF